MENETERITGRVVEQHKNIYKVSVGGRTIQARISGRLEYQAVGAGDYPAVGDYVVLDRDDDAHGDAVISEILERKSLFARKAAGTAGGIQYMAEGATVAFIGSSGAGKSTLVNRLAGAEVMDTGGLRQIGKGRHTTTHRQLVSLPSGCYVIDTPGMRELGIEDADFGRAFGDIEALAEGCRFRDCTHSGEPGCAVEKAAEEGLLDAGRLANYKKMLAESRYEGMNSREREQVKMRTMFKEFGGVKNAKEYVKNKRNRGL